LKVLVDPEGRAVIEQLCDIALKAGGMTALQGVVNFLQCIKPIPVEVKEDGSPSECDNPEPPDSQGSG
jgi:hypothetical protein